MNVKFYALVLAVFFAAVLSDLVWTFCVRKTSQGFALLVGLSSILVVEISTHITLVYVKDELFTHVLAVGSGIGGYLMIKIDYWLARKFPLKLSCPACLNRFVPIRNFQGAHLRCPECQTLVQVNGCELVDISDIDQPTDATAANIQQTLKPRLVSPPMTATPAIQEIQ
ncbi:hypothetical protein D4R52_00165 [bacterium]|nr:MAG: hypothetical protein D4R52_00165 [bacterium]